MSDEDSYEARAAARAAKRASRAIVPGTGAAALSPPLPADSSKSPNLTATSSVASSTAQQAAGGRRRFRESDFEQPSITEASTSSDTTNETTEAETQAGEEAAVSVTVTESETKETETEHASTGLEASMEKVSVEDSLSPTANGDSSSSAFGGDDDAAALNKPKRASRRFGGDENPPRAKSPTPQPERSKSPVGSATTAVKPTTEAFNAARKFTNEPNSASNDKFAAAAKKFEQGSSSSAAAPASPVSKPTASNRQSVAMDPSVDPNSEPAKLVKRIVDGDEEVSWGLFDIKNNQLVVFQSGNGTVDDLRKHLDHSLALYGYLRVGIGAEQRKKFVFIRWVGDKITPMTRARILNNEGVAKKYMKITHVEIFTSFHDELTQPKVATRLAKAAGANYDKDQNEGTTNSQNTSFSQYKFSSRDFFSNKEREGTVKSVVYTKAPLPKTTPVDLNARQFTVGATQAQKNTILAVPGVDTKKSGDEQ